MIEPLLTGFLLGSSLIIAIGPQNIFVLRQGLIKKHVFLVAAFCSLSDIILIFIGIGGMSLIFSNVINNYSDYLFGISAIWLTIYSFTRFISAVKSKKQINMDSNEKGKIFSIMTTLFIITFANPHVYLDTIVLIGSVSQQFTGSQKYIFGLGSSISSVFFFFTLAYGSKLILPIMKSSLSWRVLDMIIGTIMLIISFNLVMQIKLFN